MAVDPGGTGGKTKWRQIAPFDESQWLQIAPFDESQWRQIAPFDDSQWRRPKFVSSSRSFVFLKLFTRGLLLQVDHATRGRSSLPHVAVIPLECELDAQVSHVTRVRHPPTAGYFVFVISAKTQVCLRTDVCMCAVYSQARSARRRLRTDATEQRSSS